VGPWLASLVVTATAATSPTTTPGPVATTTSGCDAAALRADLRARDPSDLTLGALADTLTVTSTGGALVATLTQPGDAAHAPRRRTLRAARCDTLARAVALVAARWAREPAPPPEAALGDPPTPPREQPTPPREQPTPRPAPPTDDALALRFALLGVAHVDVLPGFAGGVGGALDVVRGPWLVRATLELARSDDLILTPTTRVWFLAPATRASLCRRALGDDDGVALSGCGHATLALVVAGRVDGDVGGDDGFAAWLGLGGGARLDARLGFARLTAEVGVSGAAARSTIALADGTRVYTPGVVAPFAALGVGLALP
jgi:hypothetical protein